MTLTSTAIPVRPVTPARAYARAHEGKLMIIERKEGRGPSVDDFFQFHDVGTHPTGLIVSGIFQDSRRAHVMESGVRDANAAETAWLAAAKEAGPVNR